ncbi:unnamed protein product, partial [Hapterophycus canaliculatus]
IQEARRQAEICNACRYCEGYCAVFPSLHDNRAFSDGDITQLANLCHNCRGCYYACQYTAPHEFNLNLPAALAEVRHDSWEDFAYPRSLARAFQSNGIAIAVVVTLCFAVLFALASVLGRSEGAGFYGVMSHNLMIAIFIPAFVFPLISIAVSLRRYWAATDGERVTLPHVLEAIYAAASMRNLAGGHGEGCNFEDEDRFTQARRLAHQLVLYGFALCFASTASGSVLHYVFDLPAPYGIWSLPKLLGVPGGVLMTFGALWLIDLKRKADPALGAVDARSGEYAFIALLGFVGLSG